MCRSAVHPADDRPFLFCVHHVDKYQRAMISGLPRRSRGRLGQDLAGVDGWRRYPARGAGFAEPPGASRQSRSHGEGSSITATRSATRAAVAATCGIPLAGVVHSEMFR